jgi:phosphohistidine phosphatase
LLIGHNPGLEQMAALLASGQSGDFRGMPAGGVAVLSLPADAQLEPGVAKLAAFWWP